VEEEVAPGEEVETLVGLGDKKREIIQI